MRELVGWGSRNGESRGGLVGGASLMRAECLRCLGVGYELEILTGRKSFGWESAADGYMALNFFPTSNVSKPHCAIQLQQPRESLCGIPSVLATISYSYTLSPSLLPPPLSPDPDPRTPTHRPPYAHLINHSDSKTPRARKSTMLIRRCGVWFVQVMQAR